MGTELIIKATVPGKNLEGIEYTHPLNGRISKVIGGDHVTTQSGTGLVHTAPGHGMEDFEACKHNGITEILCPGIDCTNVHHSSLVKWIMQDVLPKKLVNLKD
jgi:isoleucyl-tRNA synthetase